MTFLLKRKGPKRMELLGNGKKTGEIKEIEEAEVAETAFDQRLSKF